AYFMFLVSIVYLVFAREIITWFNDTPSVVDNGALCLQIIAAGYIFYAYGMVVSQAFNGAGDTKTPTKINFIAFWLFQLPFAYIAAITFELGALGVFMAITFAEVMLSVIAILWFRKGHWKKVVV
ncbi:MAG TPA: MATE family efflux transporter, partial [Eudoraea sp.]|nr:MATE family efflux transporter [Eudoraea sp.]